MKHTVSSVLAFCLMIAPALVSAEVERVDATVPSGKTISIPAHAVEVAPNVYALGEAFDEESGEMVEGYMIVHKAKENNAKSSTGNARAPKTSCYAFMAAGAKWKVVEPWLVNPTNDDGLDQGSVFSVMNTAVSLWESAADGVVGGGGVNILGVGTTSYAALVADESATDGVNEVYFGDLAEANTIGVTIVWGIFGGPTQNRQLVEWDQVYNTDYTWSLTGEAGKMDFQNIATHELGHTFGLSDLYTSACSNETMYGYGTEGETKKQTLNAGDISGINTLY